jgi:hypothetical protein
MAGISRPFFRCDRQNQRRSGKKVKKPQRLRVSRCKKSWLGVEIGSVGTS